MSLDFDLHEVKRVNVFSGNITHNLTKMAKHVPTGTYSTLYDELWNPDTTKKARDLVEPLKRGVQFMKENKKMLQQFDAKNGWGTWSDLLEFTKRVRHACQFNPEAEITVSK